MGGTDPISRAEMAKILEAARQMERNWKSVKEDLDGLPKRCIPNRPTLVGGWGEHAVARTAHEVGLDGDAKVYGGPQSVDVETDCEDVAECVSGRDWTWIRPHHVAGDVLAFVDWIPVMNGGSTAKIHVLNQSHFESKLNKAEKQVENGEKTEIKTRFDFIDIREDRVENLVEKTVDFHLPMDDL